jgi:hypothetical protein
MQSLQLDVSTSRPDALSPRFYTPSLRSHAGNLHTHQPSARRRMSEKRTSQPTTRDLTVRLNLSDLIELRRKPEHQPEAAASFAPLKEKRETDEARGSHQQKNSRVKSKLPVKNSQNFMPVAI